MNALKDAGRKLLASLIDLVTSKKAIAAAVAWLAAIFIKDPAQRDAAVAAIVGYIFSQGYVDHAKEIAKKDLGVTTTKGPDGATIATVSTAPPAPGITKVGILLAFLGLAFGASGCATVGPVVQACKDCAVEQGAGDLRDLEQQAGPFVEHAFMCDPTFAGAALPPCLVAALEGVVVAMGPDGVRFRDCVIAKVEADQKAPPLAKKRAHLARARIAVGMPL